MTKTITPSMSNKRSPRGTARAPLYLVTLALCAAAAWYLWTTFINPPTPSPVLQFATVTRGDIEQVVTATGTLQPRDYVDVGAQVSGQLRKMHVDVGAQVNAGDLLVEIDPTVLQSRVDATRAQLRFQRAQLVERKSGLTLARIQHERQKSLMAEGATSEEALQTAEAALRSANAQIDALQAQIEQTTSNLRADEANLNYAHIFAPMSGTVVSVTARLGQTINASQQAPVLLRIADLASMTVQTQVSEADVGRLRIDMPAYFNRLGNREQRWHGRLRKIEPTPVVQNNVVLFNALFDVPNPDHELMTQMTAQVFFVVAAARDALLIPASALSAGTPREAGTGARRGEGSTRGRTPPSDSSASPTRATVMVALADGTLEPRTVETGVSNRIQVQIVSGLAEGERVVSGSTSSDAGSGTRRTPAS